MNNNKSTNLSAGAQLVIAATLLAMLVLVFSLVRQNREEIRSALQLLSTQSDAAQALAAENTDLRALVNPKVILIIGDGMDDQQITMARNYFVGSTGKLTIDTMPFRGAAQVQAVAEDDPARPVYISDSANAATTLASGVLTSPKRIATTAGTDTDIVTIMEMANAAGIGTGVVTTSSVTDATPAAFLTHINNRLCHVPVDMVKSDATLPYNNRDCSVDSTLNGGPGSIAEQIAQASVNIVIGGGAGLFEHASELHPEHSIGKLAQLNGFRIVDELDDLDGIQPHEKALALVAPYDMPVRLKGVEDQQAETLARDSGKPVLPAPFDCEDNRRARNLPTLALMTRAAIDVLDKHERFMLMIESASIDKESHRRHPCGHIGEVRQLDEATQVALDYAAMHPEVLVIVTADHGQAAHIIPEVSRWAPLDNASPGHFARLRTLEGTVMGINYATNDAPQEEHTGTQVPVYAAGFGSGRLPIFLSQADIYRVMARHLGLIN